MGWIPMNKQGQTRLELKKGKYRPAVKTEEGVIPPTVEASWNMFEELLSAEIAKKFDNTINTSEDSLQFERMLHPYRVIQEAMGDPYMKILKTQILMTHKIIVVMMPPIS